LASRRSRHKARTAKQRSVSESVVVTHPFHPLFGQRLDVLLERRRPGAGVVYVCAGGPAGRVTLPVGWTDRSPAPLAHRLTPEALGDLAGLVAALESRCIESDGRS
jgi:uncharacterized protein DUF5372